MKRGRDGLPRGERDRLSQAASARLLELPELGTANVVAVFAPAGCEIDPTPVWTQLGLRGAAVAFPRVTKLVPRLRFCLVRGPEDLAVGAFGVREPLSHCAEVGLDQIDVVVMPGLAFDPQGRRLGYGGGYYDEVASRVRIGGRAILVGIGFDFQVVGQCPAGDGDERIDFVVTDARVVRCDFSRT